MQDKYSRFHLPNTLKKCSSETEKTIDLKEGKINGTTEHEKDNKEQERNDEQEKKEK